MSYIHGGPSPVCDFNEERVTVRLGELAVQLWFIMHIDKRPKCIPTKFDQNLSSGSVGKAEYVPIHVPVYA